MNGSPDKSRIFVQLGRKHGKSALMQDMLKHYLDTKVFAEVEAVPRSDAFELIWSEEVFGVVAEVNARTGEVTSGKATREA